MLRIDIQSCLAFFLTRNNDKRLNKLSTNIDRWEKVCDAKVDYKISVEKEV